MLTLVFTFCPLMSSQLQVNYGLFVEEHHDAVGSVHPSLLHHLPVSDQYLKQCVFISWLKLNKCPPKVWQKLPHYGTRSTLCYLIIKTSVII